MPCRASRPPASSRRSDAGPTDGIVLRPLTADARRRRYHTRMGHALIVRGEALSKAEILACTRFGKAAG
jgi:hypothetical protein